MIFYPRARVSDMREKYTHPRTRTKYVYLVILHFIMYSGVNFMNQQTYRRAMVAGSGFVVSAVAATAVLAALVWPVLAQELMCPELYHLEQHVGDPNYGNVCRSDGADNAFVCPRYCTATNGPPYCRSTTVAAAPCRATLPAPPQITSWPTLHSPHEDLQRSHFGFWQHQLGRFRRQEITSTLLMGPCEVALLNPRSRGSSPVPRTYARNATVVFGSTNSALNVPHFPHTHDVNGDVAVWNGWHQGNYGHTIIDTLPATFYLLRTTNRTVLIVDTEVSRSILTAVLSRKHAARLRWVQHDEQVRIAGSLIVLHTPPTQNGLARFAPPLQAAMHAQLASLTDGRRPPPSTIIYYSRQSQGAMHGRQMDHANEAALIAALASAIARWRGGIKLVVFNGNDEAGARMSVAAQMQLFSTAEMVVGPHGLGLANIAWMDWSGRPKVLEFVCTPLSRAVQPGCPWGKTYFSLLGAPPVIEYHHIAFSPKSNAAFTYVDVPEFARTLDRIMAPFPETLRFMLPFDSRSAASVPFFWHVPKAAGSYFRQIFHLGYGIRPQASLGTPAQVDMFARRMEALGPTPEDIALATTKCTMLLKMLRGPLPPTYRTTWMTRCMGKLALRAPEHACLPDCFGGFFTPLLYSAARIFARTYRSAKVATILRDPIARFVSKFTYLKTAAWEYTYSPTAVTIDQYIQKGMFERSWMVCTLSACSGATTQNDLGTAKRVLARMLVGFTDNVDAFICRVEHYWGISAALRKKARDGPMKAKVNVQASTTNKTKTELSETARGILAHELRHDIELYQFAKHTLWPNQQIPQCKSD